MLDKRNSPANMEERFHQDVCTWRFTPEVELWLWRLHRFTAKDSVRHVTSTSHAMTLEHELVRHLRVHYGAVDVRGDRSLEVINDIHFLKYCRHTT